MNLIKQAHAIVCNPVLEDCKNISPDSIGNKPTVYINSVLQTIISIAFIFGIIYFIYHFILAGFHMISSQGDPKKYEEAQHSLLYSFMGIILIFSIFAILKIVGTVFGIQGLDTLTISWPSL